MSHQLLVHNPHVGVIAELWAAGSLTANSRPTRSDDDPLRSDNAFSACRVCRRRKRSLLAAAIKIHGHLLGVWGPETAVDQEPQQRVASHGTAVG
jgi:hypothetical protein